MSWWKLYKYYLPLVNRSHTFSTLSTLYFWDFFFSFLRDISCVRIVWEVSLYASLYMLGWGTGIHFILHLNFFMMSIWRFNFFCYTLYFSIVVTYSFLCYEYILLLYWRISKKSKNKSCDFVNEYAITCLKGNISNGRLINLYFNDDRGSFIRYMKE